MQSAIIENAKLRKSIGDSISKSEIVVPQGKLKEIIDKINQNYNVQIFTYKQTDYDNLESLREATEGCSLPKLGLIFVNAMFRGKQMHENIIHELLHFSDGTPAFKKMLKYTTANVKNATFKEFCHKWGLGTTSPILLSEITIEAFLGNVPELKHEAKKHFKSLLFELLVERSSIERPKVKPGKTVEETLRNVKKVKTLNTGAIRKPSPTLELIKA